MITSFEILNFENPAEYLGVRMNDYSKYETTFVTFEIKTFSKLFSPEILQSLIGITLKSINRIIEVFPARLVQFQHTKL